MTIEMDSDGFDEKSARDLISKLQTEIKDLQQENDSLKKDIQGMVEYICELRIILGEMANKVPNKNAKYLLEKYMLDHYHGENKTKPILKE
jgi:FtsZ-binding cell division protein ZapB